LICDFPLQAAHATLCPQEDFYLGTRGGATVFLQLVVRGHARWNWLPFTGNTCNIAILGLGQNEDGHGSTVDSSAFVVGQLCCADGSDPASDTVGRQQKK
jgi:hypothetical protein